MTQLLSPKLRNVLCLLVNSLKQEHIPPLLAGMSQKQDSAILAGVNGRHAYFVHSYRALPTPENRDWVLATSDYGGEFVSAIKKGEVSAQQIEGPALEQCKLALHITVLS